MTGRTALVLAATLVAEPLHAQASDETAYVEANLLSIFYHELGHALIDVLSLPVLGQEEDAADTASILMIDAFYEEEAAQEIAQWAAFGFLDEADAAGDAEPPWWDEHGPDQQRYYNLVCLFYGAAPEERRDLADALDLPEERADGCAEEFDLAAESWQLALDVIATDTAADTLKYDSGKGTITQDLIAAEVMALNTNLRLPQDVILRVEPCNEANAYYDPTDQSITMCTELEDHLRGLFAQNQ